MDIREKKELFKKMDKAEIALHKVYKVLCETDPSPEANGPEVTAMEDIFQCLGNIRHTVATRREG